MDLSNDPEIICVFCGIGFSSVENVEMHIQENHQSSSIDQIENRKPSIDDDYAGQTVADEICFPSNDSKDPNLIAVQKDCKSDLSSQDTPEIFRPKLLNKTSSQCSQKNIKIHNLLSKSNNDAKKIYSDLDNRRVNDEHKMIPILNISQNTANLEDYKVDNSVKRSLRCQNCDKQFTLSNNLSRHRRLYCSSLKDVQNAFCRNGTVDCHETLAQSAKGVINSKFDDISNKTCDDDLFSSKREVRAKFIRPLPKYKCPKCFKRFIYKITQILHLQNHETHNARKWKCNKCGFRYSRRQILCYHQQRSCSVIYSQNKSNPKPNNKTYPESHICQFCDMNFINEAYMKMHQLRVCLRYSNGKTKDNRFIGNHPVTGSISVGKAENNEVYKISKIENNDYLPKESSSKSCSVDQCGSDMFETESSPRSSETKLNGISKIEDSPSNDNAKFQNHHYTDETQSKLFQCEVCKKSFSSRSSLSNHIKSHYSSRGQPFTCRDCNRRFVNLLSLQDHRREMCSQKSYESEQKAIYSLSNFNGVSQVPIWPNISNTNTVNQPVTCLHCNGVFYDRLELEEHALSKHSNEHGNILCLLCDRSFTTNMALRVHLTKSHGFANGGCPGVSQNLPPMPKLETNYHIDDDFPIKKRRKEKRLNFSTGQALGNHKRTCLNLPNEFISVESKPTSQNSKSNSKLHSIESLIFDNTNIRSSFTNDKNVFLAFN